MIQRPFTLIEAATIWLNCLQNPTYGKYLLIDIVNTVTPADILKLPPEFQIWELWSPPQLLLYLSLQLNAFSSPNMVPGLHVTFMDYLPEFSFQENQSSRCLLLTKQYLKCRMTESEGSSWLTYEQLKNLIPCGVNNRFPVRSVEFTNCAKINLVELKRVSPQSCKQNTINSPISETRLLKRNKLQALFDEAAIELDLLRLMQPSLFCPGSLIIINPIRTVAFTPKDPPVVVGASKGAHVSLAKVYPAAALQHLIFSYDTDKGSAVLSNVGYEQSVYYVIYKPGFKSNTVDLRPGGKLFFKFVHNYDTRPVMIAVYLYTITLLVHAF